MSNRKRNLTMTIRVTPSEKDAILRKASSLKSMEAVASALESKLKKVIIGTAVSSVTLSVLVCLALRHWAG